MTVYALEFINWHYFNLFYGDCTVWIWVFVFILVGLPMCFYGLKHYKWLSFSLGAMYGVCVGLYTKSRLAYGGHVNKDKIWIVLGLLMMVIVLGVLD